jgi:eukaryotic-like serine/threonine-protein kinase
MHDAEAALYVGQLFGGRYRAIRLRGRGQFSGVFAGIDELDGEPVALKLLSGLNPSPSAVLEFDGEAELLRKLTACTNVVDLLDAGVESIDAQITLAASGPPSSISLDVRYIVLELADASLDELLAARIDAPLIEKLMIFRQLVRGVHQMHLNGCVHRDVKSDNALLFTDGSETVAKISDLGRSRYCRAPARFPILSYESGRGDFRFAPPELLWRLGDEDPLSFMLADLYHLGSLLFELVIGAGVTAFALGDFQRIRDHSERLGNEAARRADYRARTSELRGRYQLAYELFDAAIPAPVRGLLGALLRQLTDVEPSRRLPQIPPGSRLPRAWDLQWLLRRIDIVLKVLVIAEAPKPPRWVKARRS